MNDDLFWSLSLLGIFVVSIPCSWWLAGLYIRIADAPLMVLRKEISALEKEIANEHGLTIKEVQQMAGRNK